MTGRIISLQRMSYHDGPGIRTTVFFAGCNLSCGWCHNPESQKMTAQLQYFSRVCTGCGVCVKSCPSHALSLEGGRIIRSPERCSGCFVCVDCCVPGARRISSREISSQELCRTVQKDESYYRRSGGGVTFSGGEPFLQPEFLRECLEALKSAGIHTAVESALCVPEESVRLIAPLVDLFMCDIKVMDEETHIRHTGASNRRILSNIRLLSELGCKTLIRVPLVEGVNDTRENLESMAGFLIKETGFRDVELLRLHLLSANKYSSLEMADTLSGYSETTEKALDAAKQILRTEGLNVL